MGQIANARTAFERAYSLAPHDPRCFFTVVNAQQVHEGDPVFATLSRWEHRVDSVGRDERILIHFALSKALSDVGRFDESVRHLLIGNRLKRSTLIYDEERTLSVLQQIEEVFTPELFARFNGMGHSSPLPILIVGLPRSGSTLIEQILASHSAVFAGGERADLAAAMNKIGIDASASNFPRSCAHVEHDQLARLGTDYVARLSAAARTAGFVDAARVTDKMLANLPFSGILHLALPNARIIHARRDPIDHFMSCFSKLFAEDIPYAYDPGEFGRYHRACEKLTEHWNRVLPPGVILDVQYEKLVADFEPQARRIVMHCGLEWDDACLSFHEIARPVKTASVSQVRQPIYRSSVGRWRSVSDDLLRPLLDALNGI